MWNYSAFLLGLAAPQVMAHKFFDIPPGAAGKVSIIDSTLRASGMQDYTFVTPKLEGFDELAKMPAWSFLVESSTGTKVVFDLAVPPDLAYAPAVIDQLKSYGWDVQIDKHVAEILTEGGVNITEIGSVIWSHYHFDHIGDIATFPLTTEIVVGPGFSKAYLPAYPTNPNSTLLERYFTNRTLREISFKTPLKAGAFPAYDFFGDGSFFLLDAPGHTTGHLGGLVRTTTNPDTFVFMGGDLCHHSAQLRPSPERPIPSNIHLHDLLSDIQGYKSAKFQCPGSIITKPALEHLNIKRGRKPDQPFFDPVLAEDITLATETIRKTQKADADSDVWFVAAHDPHIIGVVDFFPKAANQWKKKGWADKVRWAFLNELVGALEVDLKAE
ncbi:beta-lactamase-like protein [Lasiosphaeris hirsuta]|uniref:Beta-lactamase-like protein n=1 Tax=Lasiosphaeris hirsuta TaxID=260670 RepID=A0AA40AZW3_9PEZI|nr:beta-lactamase-like protein [Lasiosphaeris hirsuta]